MLIHIEAAAKMIGVIPGELFHSLTRTGEIMGIKLPKATNTNRGGIMPRYMFDMDEFIKFSSKIRNLKKSSAGNNHIGRKR